MAHRTTVGMRRGRSLAAVALLVALTVLFTAVGLTTHPAAAQDDPDAPVPPGSTPSSVPVTTAAPIITTTLPEGNTDLGRIIPRPNSGAEPTSPGDRGGWQQLALFLFVCAVIVAMAVFVWWRSRIARRRREVEGHDRVRMAEAHGADARKPRPPGIVD